MICRRIGTENYYYLLVNDDVINDEGIKNWIPDHIRDELSQSDTGFDTTSIILRYLCILYEHGVVRVPSKVNLHFHLG